MDIFDMNKIYIFLLFFVPGFISTKIWNLLVPSEVRKISDYVLETVSYSCINLAVLYWLIKIVINQEFRMEHPNLTNFYILAILFILPIIWPILVFRILNLDFLKGRIIHPTPKSWDYFFGLGVPCYVLIHLKNGKLIGGLYGGDSFASSFPNKEDMYLQEVWGVNEKGEFQQKIENTRGLWISKDFFDYIEFLDVIKEEN